MAALTYTESSSLILSLLQANTANNPPFTAAQILEQYNNAYSDVWEDEGGANSSVTGAGTTWTPSPTTLTDGKLVGVLRDIRQVLHVGATTSASGLVGDAATNPLDRVEYARIQWLRGSGGVGTYAIPQVYSVTRKRASSDVAANVGRYDLDVWPGVAGYYFPMEYIKQFAPLAGSGTDVPDVTDLGSRDICHIAAFRMAPLSDRARLATVIASGISQKSREMMARKMNALISADQDA